MAGESERMTEQSEGERERKENTDRERERERGGVVLELVYSITLGL